LLPFVGRVGGRLAVLQLAAVLARGDGQDVVHQPAGEPLAGARQQVRRQHPAELHAQLGAAVAGVDVLTTRS
jgi:hypothetical protein